MKINLNTSTNPELFYVVPEHRHSQPPLIHLHAGTLTLQMTLEEADRLATYLSAAIVAANDTEQRIEEEEANANTCSDCGNAVSSLIICPDGAEVCQVCFDDRGSPL